MKNNYCSNTIFLRHYVDRLYIALKIITINNTTINNDCIKTAIFE